MDVRKLGHWLALLAIALHAAWPLLANAGPKSVHLVPLCTVEGITHYLEVPGSTPLDDSANAHHDHCAFCFLGAGGLLPSHADAPLASSAAIERIAFSAGPSQPNAVLIIHGARAPPLPPVVMTNFNYGRHGEINLFARRAARAPYS